MHWPIRNTLVHQRRARLFDAAPEKVEGKEARESLFMRDIPIPVTAYGHFVFRTLPTSCKKLVLVNIIRRSFFCLSKFKSLRNGAIFAIVGRRSHDERLSYMCTPGDTY